MKTRCEVRRPAVVPGPRRLRTTGCGQNSSIEARPPTSPPSSGCIRARATSGIASACASLGDFYLDGKIVRSESPQSRSASTGRARSETATPRRHRFATLLRESSTQEDADYAGWRQRCGGSISVDASSAAAELPDAGGILLARRSSFACPRGKPVRRELPSWASPRRAAPAGGHSRQRSAAAAEGLRQRRICRVPGANPLAAT